MTDHMLIMHYEPENGWSAPEIKPYGPLSIDPASSCLQYCPNVFEGMKVCLFATMLVNLSASLLLYLCAFGRMLGSFFVRVMRPWTI